MVDPKYVAQNLTIGRPNLTAKQSMKSPGFGYRDEMPLARGCVLRRPQNTAPQFIV
ncbi:hypothetical protein H1P_1910010 [Hyella patelloides LEGE 07179]|uniref:Uncharacterized protein n=1 Tax=Hyella patelloides LEGE 07179 TaxID=945734 RepID=A0A563VPT1_9CYAN|nr:hypothetical protein H1P_1910010 [Hyella patelloides LEGE 07179]